MLYFRQILTMLISLFTVRIVLKTLGVQDYGIYNVIGGVVTMFAFLSNTMGAASQRFLSFELGRQNYNRLQQIFSLTVLSYFGIAFIILLLSETFGLWFLNARMNIPADRIPAANWVFQFSVFSMVLSILQIPYNSVIIARERMSVYAYISIFDAVLKLLIVCLLTLVSFDKLKLYSVLMFLIYSIDACIYYIYGKSRFKECRYIFYWDWEQLKEILAYSWWGMIGSIANIAKNQGINILLNIFFGPVVNAARGISYQIRNAIANFNNNFFMAVRPSIVKEYASGNQKGMMKLMYSSSKFSIFLMLALSLPILLETNYILSLWLGQIPEYVTVFTKLVMIDTFFDALILPIAACVQAKGVIRNYQLFVSGFALLNLPLSYFLLKMGYPPQSTLWTAIGLSIICYLLRLLFINKLLVVNIKDYFSKIVLKLVIVTIVTLLPSYLIINTLSESIYRLIITFISVEVTLLLSIIFIGISEEEKVYLYSMIKNKLGKINAHKLSLNL